LTFAVDLRYDRRMNFPQANAIFSSYYWYYWYFRGRGQGDGLFV